MPMVRRTLQAKLPKQDEKTLLQTRMREATMAIQFSGNIQTMLRKRLWKHPDKGKKQTAHAKLLSVLLANVQAEAGSIRKVDKQPTQIRGSVTPEKQRPSQKS
jgi:hypothetical protein